MSLWQRIKCELGRHEWERTPIAKDGGMMVWIECRHCGEADIVGFVVANRYPMAARYAAHPAPGDGEGTEPSRRTGGSSSSAGKQE